MTYNDHEKLTKMMSDLILEKGRHYADDTIPNCWEAGMMKAIVMINNYVKENGYDED